MQEIFMGHNIVIIDDNFSIRQVVKIFLARVSRNFSVSTSTFSTDNGIEGLGFIYITSPDIIIVDTTLPKYSGREVIDYLVSNPKFQSTKTKVIVLQEESHPHNLPQHFFVINKENKNSFNQLCEVLLSCMQISPKENKTTLFSKLGNFVFINGNKDDLLNKSLERKIFPLRAVMKIRWFFLEILTSIALTLMILIYGKPQDENIAQKDIDKKEFRRKYYPTLVVSFVALGLFAVNLGVFVFSQVGLFNRFFEHSRAAATFTVDSTADTSDFDTSDGVCDIDDSVGDGPCTLRAAIEQANELDIGMVYDINFNIPGGGVHTFTPATNYPSLMRSTNINGDTQPGADCSTGNLKIEIDGGNLPTSSGIIIYSQASTNNSIRGLIVNNFSNAGIYIGSQETSHIGCNILGLDSDGETEAPNGYGVLIDGADQSTITIGGITAEDRNVISGNTSDGIHVSDGAGRSNQINISGNYIGTDISGFIEKGNGQKGIFTQQMDINLQNTVTIGGNTINHRNIISGNSVGIHISGDGHLIKNNYIGVGQNGASAIGNTDSGIEVDPSSNLTIEDNIISNNGNYGIYVHPQEDETYSDISIDDNLIGTDASGDQAAGNGTGISILEGSQGEEYYGAFSNFQILNNVVSGSTYYGILLSTEDQISNNIDGVIITGNRISLAQNSDDSIPNMTGVEISTGHNHIVGTEGNGNIFGPNSDNSLLIHGTSFNEIVGNTFISNTVSDDMHLSLSHENLISRNLFVRELDRTYHGYHNLSLSNSNGNNINENIFYNEETRNGVLVADSSDNVISENRFSMNGGSAVDIVGNSVYNAILSNAFAETSPELQIDLENDGFTANDLGDVDSGPNNLQNYPENIVYNDGTISFDLDTTAGSFLVEIHKLDGMNPYDLISSLVCSSEITHTGGQIQHDISCPDLPIGIFNVRALVMREKAPNQWGDTSELSDAYEIEVGAPTPTPSPTDTPEPTLTETPIPTNTPVPTATNTPIPTATVTPVPTNTPIPTATNTPIPVPTNTSMPTNTLVPAPSNTTVPSQTNTPTTPPDSTLVPGGSGSTTPTPDELTPTGQVPTPTAGSSVINPTVSISATQIVNITTTGRPVIFPTSIYTPPDHSVSNLPIVQSAVVAVAQRMESVRESSPTAGRILDITIGISERIKPMSDNLSYLLSLQFIGTQTALAGVTSLNLMALTGATVAVTFAQPKVLYYALAWFWRRKHVNPWGVVSDKVSNAPVAFARIALLQGGKTIDTQTTDLYGKYGFVADKGSYQLVISHSDYIDYSKEISIHYDGQILSTDFELSPRSIDDFASRVRWIYYQTRKFIRKNTFILNTTLFSVGFVYALFAVTNALTIFNYVILSLYLLQITLMILFYLTREKEWGEVLDISSGMPVAGAVVRLFDNERQLDVSITDKNGRYSFLLESGTYYIKVSAPGHIFPTQDGPNIITNKVGEKMMKFTLQDPQRLNLKLYMQNYSNVTPRINTNNQAILSPFH